MIMKSISRDGSNRLPYLPPEKQKATVRTRHGTMDWYKKMEMGTSRLYIVTLLMQSTSCEMLGWMKHKLESKLLGEI